jgi:hypothetical protein
MSTEFDPYHRWLGIRPEEQPADHYRLLGLTRFEDDLEVIRDAAERQMGHVRHYALGPYRDLSQRILNELGAARACLLDPSKKVRYDDGLRAVAGGSFSAEPPPPNIVATPPGIGPTRAAPPAHSGGRLTHKKRATKANRLWTSPKVVIIGGIAAGALVATILVVLLGGKKAPNERGRRPAALADIRVTTESGHKNGKPELKPDICEDVETKATPAETKTEAPKPPPPPEKSAPRPPEEPRTKPQVELPRPSPQPERPTPEQPAEPQTKPHEEVAEPASPRDKPTLAQPPAAKPPSEEPKAEPPKTPTPPALAIAPFDGSEAKQHQGAWAKHLGVQIEITRLIAMRGPNTGYGLCGHSTWGHVRSRRPSTRRLLGAIPAISRRRERKLRWTVCLSWTPGNSVGSWLRYRGSRLLAVSTVCRRRLSGSTPAGPAARCVTVAGTRRSG